MPDAAFNPAWSPDIRAPDEPALGTITTIRYDGIRNASWTASLSGFPAGLDREIVISNRSSNLAPLRMTRPRPHEREQSDGLAPPIPREPNQGG